MIADENKYRMRIMIITITITTTSRRTKTIITMTVTTSTLRILQEKRIAAGPKQRARFAIRGSYRRKSEISKSYRRWASGI